MADIPTKFTFETFEKNLGYKIISSLGKKDNSTLYLVRNTETLLLQTITDISTNHLKTSTICRYIDITATCRQFPHICEIYPFYFDKLNSLLLFSPYVSLGSIATLKLPKIEDSYRYRLSLQIVTTLIAFSDSKIIHGNISPSTILRCDNYLDDNLILVTGYGLLPYLHIKHFNNYQSPEILREKEYDESTDIWSVGCLIYFIFNGGIPPFHATDAKDLLEKIHIGKYNKIKHCSINNLISKLLRKTQKSRLLAHELLIELKYTMYMSKYRYRQESHSIASSCNLFASLCQSSIDGEVKEEKEINEHIFNQSLEFTNEILVSLLADAYYPLSLIKNNIQIKNRLLIRQITRNYKLFIRVLYECNKNKNLTDSILPILMCFEEPKYKVRIQSYLKLEATANTFINGINDDYELSFEKNNFSSGIISNFSTYFNTFYFINALNFSGNHFNENDVIYLSLSLKKFTFLKYFNLKDTKLFSYLLNLLLSSVLYPYKIEYLNFSENPEVDDSNSLSSLQEYYNLEELNMSNLSFFTGGMSYFSSQLLSFPCLKTFKLKSIPYLCNVLYHMPMIDTLNLNHNTIPEKGIEKLSEHLSSLINLKHLQLCFNPFNDEGLGYLINSFSKLKKLETLELENCGLTDSGLTELYLHLSELSNIKNLNIKDNSISEDIIKEFHDSYPNINLII